MDLAQPDELNAHLDSSADQETRLIRKVAFYAFVLNLGLAIMKGLPALFSNSPAVCATTILPSLGGRGVRRWGNETVFALPLC
jgi:hypothetical protein